MINSPSISWERIPGQQHFGERNGRGRFAFADIGHSMGHSVSREAVVPRKTAGNHLLLRRSIWPIPLQVPNIGVLDIRARRNPP